MKTTGTIITLLWMLLSGPALKAQAQAVASLDTASIFIGDQVTLKLTFTAPAGYRIQWPSISDTLTGKVEVLRRSRIDTALTEDKKQLRLSQNLVITSFDSGYYALPPLVFRYSEPGDTALFKALTEQLLLEVKTLPVDTAKAIFDIKGPMRAPLTFRELLPWILLALVLAGGIYLLRWYLKKRKKAEPLFRLPARPKLPPHQVALDALEALRQKKLWQSGMIKEYHTELTGIVRTYIDDRFGIHALEMTSDEILEAVTKTAVDDGSREKLRSTFVLADLVKFAKEQPLPAEHDLSFSHAVDFVRNSIQRIEDSARPTTAVATKPLADQDDAGEKEQGMTDTQQTGGQA
jgi:hypothetical protein